MGYILFIHYGLCPLRYMSRISISVTGKFQIFLLKKKTKERKGLKIAIGERWKKLFGIVRAALTKNKKLDKEVVGCFCLKNIDQLEN